MKTVYVRPSTINDRPLQAYVTGWARHGCGRNWIRRVARSPALGSRAGDLLRLGKAVPQWPANQE